MAKSVLGIICGSGIYDLPRLTNAQSKTISIPWAKHPPRCSSARSRATDRPLSFYKNSAGALRSLQDASREETHGRENDA